MAAVAPSQSLLASDHLASNSRSGIQRGSRARINASGEGGMKSVTSLLLGSAALSMPRIRQDEIEVLRASSEAHAGTALQFVEPIGRVLVIGHDLTPEAAVQLLRDRKGEAPLATIVVDAQRVPIAECSLYDLVTMSSDPSRSGTPLSRLYPVPVPTVGTSAHIDEILEVAERMPAHASSVVVVNDSNELLGVIPLRTVARHAQDAADHMAEALANLGEDAQGYSTQSAMYLVQKRIPWLIMLLVLNMGSAAILSAFEKVLEHKVELAFFIPMLIDMGGNVGSQVATLLVSALASKEIDSTNATAVLLREMKTAFALSVPLAVVAMGVAFVVSTWEVGLSLVVATTMLLLVNVSNFIGSLIPFVCVKANLDPSVIVGPLITSIMDAAGLCIYFGVAQFVL